MKTLSKTQVIKNNPDFKGLINAVIRQLGGTESVEDVNSHGIDRSFPGFTYYSDTHAFAMKNRKQIVELLELSADKLGEEVASMVSHFGQFRNNPMNNEERKELYKFLGGVKCEQSTITNLMAWFATEEVCRMFEQ